MQQDMIDREPSGGHKTVFLHARSAGPVPFQARPNSSRWRMEANPMKKLRLLVAAATTGLALVFTLVAAHAQGPGRFDLARQATIATCLPNAAAQVTFFGREDTHGLDTLAVQASGLSPDTTFALFLTESPVPPFGAVQFLGDFTTNAAGRGHVSVQAIIEEAFAFDNTTGARKELNHVVFWFADPAADEFCVPGSAPTPFDGDGQAGVAAMSSRNFLPGAPLP
jgi:hypothetical protein